LINIYESAKISRNPSVELLESSFFQMYFRKKIYSFDHPLSGGINLIK
jgi:hypothetical protein